MPKTILINEQIDTQNKLMVGLIKPFGGSTLPSKYLSCDGSIVSRTTYADLFDAIGTSWGSGDGSTTFHLPDLRGRFLRCIDEGAGRDPDRGSRTASNSGGSTGDNVGSVQGQATRKNGLSASVNSGGNHRHSLHFSASTSDDANYIGATKRTGQQFYNYVDYGGAHSHSLSFGNGNNETRALNANVKYVIRALK